MGTMDAVNGNNEEMRKISQFVDDKKNSSTIATFKPDRQKDEMTQNVEYVRWFLGNLRCIDGGFNAVQSQGKFSGPGGAAGLALGVFETMRRMLGTSTNMDIIRNVILDVADDSLSAHTDHHSLKNSLPCAGCGHCMAILNKWDASNDTKNVAASWKSSLTERIKSPVVLHREHKEVAILLIPGTMPGWTLSGTGADGSQMFVAHWEAFVDAGKKFLRAVIDRLPPMDKVGLSNSARAEEYLEGVLASQLLYTVGGFEKKRALDGQAPYSIYQVEPRKFGWRVTKANNVRSVLADAASRSR